MIGYHAWKLVTTSWTSELGIWTTILWGPQMDYIDMGRYNAWNGMWVVILKSYITYDKKIGTLYLKPQMIGVAVKIMIQIWIFYISRDWLLDEWKLLGSQNNNTSMDELQLKQDVNFWWMMSSSALTYTNDINMDTPQSQMKSPYEWWYHQLNW